MTQQDALLEEVQRLKMELQYKDGDIEDLKLRISALREALAHEHEKLFRARREIGSLTARVNGKIPFSPIFEIEGRRKRTEVLFAIEPCGSVFANITVYDPPYTEGHPERRTEFKYLLFVLSRLGQRPPGFPDLWKWLRFENGGVGFEYPYKDKEIDARDESRALLEDYFSKWLDVNDVEELLERHRIQSDAQMTIPHYTATQQGPVHTGWKLCGRAKVFSDSVREKATHRDLAFAFRDLQCKESKIVIAQIIMEINPTLTNARGWWPGEEARKFLAEEAPFMALTPEHR